MKGFRSMHAVILFRTYLGVHSQGESEPSFIKHVHKHPRHTAYLSRLLPSMNKTCRNMNFMLCFYFSFFSFFHLLLFLLLPLHLLLPTVTFSFPNLARITNMQKSGSQEGYGFEAASPEPGVKHFERNISKSVRTGSGEV